MLTDSLREELKGIMMAEFSKQLDSFLPHIEKIYDTIPQGVDKDKYVKEILKNIFVGMNKSSEDFEKQMTSVLNNPDLIKGAMNAGRK